MMPRLLTLFVTLILIGPAILKGQTKDSLNFENTIIPIAFFLPETSLGLGATGITTFRNTAEDSLLRPSQFLYSAVYTLKNQVLLFLPFEIYTNHNLNRIKGELGYYRYFYNYFGIGARSSSDDLENYSVNFPRLEFSYAVSTNRICYLGGGIKYDFYNITETVTNGFLETTQPEGIQGGHKLNFQFLAAIDKRDNLIAPTKGSYLELNVEQSAPRFLSDYNYRKVNIDFRYYYKLKAKYILATNIITSHASEGTPFFDLPYISSPKRARGFSDRRFITRNILTVQLELRYPIWKKLSGTAFVAPNLLYDGDFTNIDQSVLEQSAGIGLRWLLNEREGTTIRLDVGRGDKTTNIYLTVNEAF